MSTMKYKGLNLHRFKDNPEERRFAEAWDAQQQGRTLAYLLSIQQHSPPDPTDREHEVAATVVQWLGSPVGQSFLRELGYERLATVREWVEKAAKGHDDLAEKHPQQPDRHKALALRRFAQVFLGDKP